MCRRVLRRRDSRLAVRPHSGHWSEAAPCMEYQQRGQRRRPRERSAKRARRMRMAPRAMSPQPMVRPRRLMRVSDRGFPRCAAALGVYRGMGGGVRRLSWMLRLWVGIEHLALLLLLPRPRRGRCHASLRAGRRGVRTDCRSRAPSVRLARPRLTPPPPAAGEEQERRTFPRSEREGRRHRTYDFRRPKGQVSRPGRPWNSWSFLHERAAAAWPE
jgi:hypothetical protein